MPTLPTQPADIVNRALDECGVDEIGALDEGSRQAKAAQRIYWPTIRQVLSAAHWNFARRTEVLNLLGSTGAPNTIPPPVVPSGNPVPPPWTFMYEWPPDCVNARWIPQTNPNGQIVWNTPARFLVGSFPLPNDDPQSAWADTEGHDPDQTRVILTNVQNATLVFTALMQYPNSWDPLFEQAIVKALAAGLAMPCIEDKKMAMALRRENRMLAMEAINEARVRDGNEGWTVIDHTPDWLRARTSGAAWYGPGVLWFGWTPMPWTEDAGGVY